MGVIEKEGITTDLDWEEIASFSDGLARVKIKGFYGFIDVNMNLVIKPQFDIVESFSEGYARFCIDKKWGFIDKKGNIVIKPKYTEAEDISNGIAYVRTVTTEGFIKI